MDQHTTHAQAHYYAQLNTRKINANAADTDGQKTTISFIKQSTTAACIQNQISE